MILMVILFIVSTAFAVNFKPKVSRLSSGGLELSVNNLPQAKVFEVVYTSTRGRHHGQFNQEADGDWYHRNKEVPYNAKDKLAYTIIGEIDDKTIVSKGTLQPEEYTRSVVTPPKRVRRGTVVFRDDFNGAAFDASNWDYEVSMYGGYNGEIQAYVQDHRNVFVKNGHLYVKPTFTSDDDRFTEASIHSGVMDMKALYGYCTNADRNGCYRQGTNGCIPPVMSGKIKSKHTIKFGKVEVRARIPRGDWLWPAIWMLPKNSEYGGWPASGEIDLMESRGNSFAGFDASNHGYNEVGATLHWGPSAGQNKFQWTHGDLDGDWAYAMHTYRLEWTVDHIQVFVDDHLMMNVGITQSFWSWGRFSGNNIWSSGTKAAPFDKAFYLILNVAVGGTSGFFQDSWHYNSKKPWNNNSPTVACDFWDARGLWMSSWHGNDVALEVDYVEMTQY